jgi:Amt family ammonium transporter
MDTSQMAVFIALLMPAGFALLTTGLCRARNAAHTAYMAFFSAVLAVAGFWMCGFAVTDGSLRFFLHNRAHYQQPYRNFVALLPAVVVATCIPTGALAERWRLKSFYVYALFMSMVLFPVFVRWTWGGGWLSDMDFIDVAGSGVVHALAGLCALAGALVIGPRHGRYGKSGVPVPVPAHNVPLALLGGFLLTVGWFGFNTIRASDVPVAMTATALAMCGGAIAGAMHTTLTTRKPDPTLVANGLLAGLVASSASAGLVGPNKAFATGAVAGLLGCLAVNWLDRFRVDDPVGVVAVHGVGGLWGVLATGLFSRSGHLLAQLTGCGALVVWGFGLPWAFFKALDRVVPLRVEPEAELGGLDIPETGVLGYPDIERFE